MNDGGSVNPVSTYPKGMVAPQYNQQPLAAERARERRISSCQRGGGRNGVPCRKASHWNREKHPAPPAGKGGVPCMPKELCAASHWLRTRKVRFSPTCYDACGDFEALDAAGHHPKPHRNRQQRIASRATPRPWRCRCAAHLGPGQGRNTQAFEPSGCQSVTVATIGRGLAMGLAGHLLSHLPHQPARAVVPCHQLLAHIRVDDVHAVGRRHRIAQVAVYNPSQMMIIPQVYKEGNKT